MTLLAYPTCAVLLAGLRAHAASHPTWWGLPGMATIDNRMIVPGVAAGRISSTAEAAASAPHHSTTNNQEVGVDEPDIVQTDGRRVVTVSDGELRVVDTATHKITGRLDLRKYGGADSAQLLMAGDRVLVLLGDASYIGSEPIASEPMEPVRGPYLAASSTTAVLVDIRTTPTVVGTFHTNGGFVAARMVDGTVRLVVRSSPRFTFPTEPDLRPGASQRAAYRKIVAATPLDAWLPSYTLTSGADTQTRTVPCGDVRHPKDFAGTSMISVYTIRLAGAMRGLTPVSIAADGGVAYATSRSLYVASSDGTATQLHRFDISGPGKPTYLGSASVPGQLLDSYAMSLYRNSLRVVTTTDAAHGSTSLYVVNADTLRVTGHVAGLGPGEQLHAVRFLGPLAYVVTFESVDPLFVLDLHDPAHPRKAGELTVTGYSDYLHPVATGRLLGVGEDVDSARRVSGLQVSLFDVADPGQPRRLDRVVAKHTPSENPIDPHAFLYWPQTGTAVVPIDSWNETQSGAALVLHVSPNLVQIIGTIRNPAGGSDDGSGIERTLVIGSTIWTMSSAGLAVSDLTTLHREAWIPFR